MIRWRSGAGEGKRTSLIILAHCGASILSIWYYPDRIHIALIVPSFAVLIGDILEGLLRALTGDQSADVAASVERSAGGTRGMLTTATGYLIAAAVIVSTVVLARDHYHERWRTLAYPFNGPFGRIDMRDPEMVRIHVELDRLLSAVPDRTLFCHVLDTYTCLFVDGHNPTPYELLVNHYNSPAQFAEVTHILTLKKVQYVVGAPAALTQQDPIGAFVRRNYEQIARGGTLRSIWRRKPDAPQSVD